MNGFDFNHRILKPWARHEKNRATRLAKRDLQLHGWIYDIRTGDVSAYDEEENAFTPVDTHYAEEVAKLTNSDHRAAVK